MKKNQNKTAPWSWVVADGHFRHYLLDMIQYLKIKIKLSFIVNECHLKSSLCGDLVNIKSVTFLNNFF